MESSYDALRALTSSKLRWGILESLESPKRLADLRRIVGANAPNTSTKAKDLQRMGLIERDDGDYRITCMGHIVRERMSFLADTLEALYEHREFWPRILDGLPEDVLARIHLFKGAKFLKNDKKQLRMVEAEILKRIRKAEGELFIVLPAHSREILDAVESVSGRVKTRVITLRENPKLCYGLLASKKFTILFTDMLDMALVKEHAFLPVTA